MLLSPSHLPGRGCSGSVGTGSSSQEKRQVAGGCGQKEVALRLCRRLRGLPLPSKGCSCKALSMVLKGLGTPREHHTNNFYER